MVAPRSLHSISRSRLELNSSRTRSISLSHSVHPSDQNIVSRSNSGTGEQTSTNNEPWQSSDALAEKNTAKTIG
eukprot:6204146-Pleurochrysis_carterae.AAC.1